MDLEEQPGIADNNNMEDSASLKSQEMADVTQEHDQNPDILDTQESPISASQLSLDISREQTPETTDEGASTYTDSAPGSPGSSCEETQNRGPTASLNIDAAVVRKTTIDETGETGETPENASLMTREIHKKRFTGRAIEKQWEMFDNESFKSFENLCEISMNSVLERFKDSKQRDTKVSETQRILTQRWLSSKLPKSFLARLKVTKLPPVKSLIVRMRGVKENTFDPLNIDQVKLRKAIFETYLSAEMKQLESLEAYHTSLQNTYNSDLEYLNDFKKTTANSRSQVSHERSKNAKELHLVSKKEGIPDIRLKPKLPATSTSTSTTLAKARFDPDHDEDLKSLLSDINSEVSKLGPRKQESLDLCDQLDIIENQLYTRKSMD